MRCSPTVATAVLFAGATLILAGCGSGTPTTSGGTTDSIPAAVHIAAGDGQTAQAGSALAVHPAVTVVNASGRALAGVAVVFAIDSGSGSIAGGTATTGNDGIAAAGTWTLGTGSATNVLSATVGGIAPVRFHAQVLTASAETLFSGAAVGVGGGTLVFQHAGDALNGLTVTVPAASYAVASSWSVVADPGIHPTLPADFTQIGPALVVGNGQGYADSTMLLTVPLPIAASNVVAPFFYDAASGTFEGIPLVDRTDSTVTLGTRHFAQALSAAALATSAGSLRAALNSSFGTVTILWVQIPVVKLMGTYQTGFAPGVDDWEFINYGDYQSPGGDCYGMSVTALYYYFSFRGGASPARGLFHRYDASLKNQWDNVQGIRFAGAVQADLSAGWTARAPARQALQDKAVQNGAQLAWLTSESIVLNLKLTKQPVALGIQNAAHGHEVIAVAATASSNGVTVSIADPNYPGTLRTMQFDPSGNLMRFTAATSASSASEAYTSALLDGITAELPLNTMATRWQEFSTGKAGADRMPSSYSFQYYSPLQEQWLSLPATLKTSWSSFKVRLNCPGCPKKAADGGNGMPADLWKADGSVPSSGELPAGANSFFVIGNASPPWDNGFGFVDTSSTVVTYTPFVLAPQGDTVSTADTVTFSVAPHGLATPTSTFTWEFRDATAGTGPVPDSIVKHPFGKTGTYVVRVTLRDGSGTIVARDSVAVAVKAAPHWVWNLDAVTQTGTLPPPSYETASDTLELNTVNGWLADLHAHPENWVFFGVDSAGCKGVVLEQFSDGGVVSGFMVPSAVRTGLAATPSCLSPGDPDIVSASFGTIGSGVLSGTVTPRDLGDAVGVRGGSINAQMSGDQLTGTFTWILYYSTGYATYSFSFSATMIGGG